MDLSDIFSLQNHGDTVQFRGHQTETEQQQYSMTFDNDKTALIPMQYPQLPITALNAAAPLRDSEEREAHQTSAAPTSLPLSASPPTHKHIYCRVYDRKIEECRCTTTRHGGIEERYCPKRSKRLLSLESGMEYVRITDLLQPQQSVAFQRVLREGNLGVQQVKEIYGINLRMLDGKRKYIEHFCRGLKKEKAKRYVIADVRAIHAVLGTCEEWFRRRAIKFPRRKWWTYTPVYAKRWARKVPIGWTGIKPEVEAEPWEQWIRYDPEESDGKEDVGMKDCGADDEPNDDRKRLSDEDQQKSIKQLLRTELRKVKQDVEAGSGLMVQKTDPVTVEELLGEE